MKRNPLTAEEVSLLKKLGNGYSMKNISIEFEIPYKLTCGKIKNICKKLKANSNTNCVYKALQNNYID